MWEKQVISFFTYMHRAIGIACIEVYIACIYIYSAIRALQEILPLQSPKKIKHYCKHVFINIYYSL